MLYPETVESGTLELLRTLMRDSRFSDFLLAGGTNLALRLGHRYSIDLDLFSYQHFDSISLAEYLTENYNFEKTEVKERDTVMGFIDNIKVDIIAHIYPLIDEPFIAENLIRLYSIRDIVAMKLVAISDSGKRLKDFVDIAFLSTKMSLNQMLDAYSQKYQRSSSLHALRGLAYFDDINFDVSINLTNGVFSWKKIEKRIREMIKYETRIFETPPC